MLNQDKSKESSNQTSINYCDRVSKKPRKSAGSSNVPFFPMALVKGQISTDRGEKVVSLLREPHIKGFLPFYGSEA